ncbi:unnamed protein product, partial [Darwinula stevensoni]
MYRATRTCMWRSSTKGCSYGWSVRRLLHWLNPHICIGEPVAQALKEKKSVVALESTIITHGMPFPDNVEAALRVEDIVRDVGATPATIGILKGKACIGLSPEAIEELGKSSLAGKCFKASARDLPHVIQQGGDGGTTVAGTLVLAHLAGIQVFVTGGIGGVHRGAETSFDVSADLIQLSRSPVAVICAGIKAILDIPKTLEFLETQGVPVAVLGPDKRFPNFYSRDSGVDAPWNLENSVAAARLLHTHFSLLPSPSGVLIGVPIPLEHALDGNEVEKHVKEALEAGEARRIQGKDVTPFLLSQMQLLTCGSSLSSNIALIKNNAKVGAEIALHLAHLQSDSRCKKLASGTYKCPTTDLTKLLNASDHTNDYLPTRWMCRSPRFAIVYDIATRRETRNVARRASGATRP